MRAVGIIAEYNPFHNGHRWHVREAKSLSGCDYAVAVMSGNFVQRGEPAIFDKWSRAEMAVRGGVDLVIELPTAFAVRSAQYFATGGIRLLQSLGVVSHVCFGVEIENSKILENVAAQMDALDIGRDLKKALKSGATYARAVEAALDPIWEDLGFHGEKLAGQPNTILAVEYLRAIGKYAPLLLPLMVKRRIAAYHERTIAADIASATAIRESILRKEELDTVTHGALPPASSVLIERLLSAGKGPVTAYGLSGITLSRLRTATPALLANTADISEGLHHKILRAALNANTVEELIHQVISKRYTRTRLQRIMTQQLLGIQKKDILCYDTTGPLYVRVLAFNRKGRQILRHIRTNSTLPIVTKTTDMINSKIRLSNHLSNSQKMLSLDTYATDLWSLAVPNPGYRLGGQDFIRSPVLVD
ncbi:nucleotidyltransferase [Acetonema longum]|uniref:tRNA(Met) cytidine acetate ligase n=1 Tax=Acetonema longum DSM 6540 TaxID=1009370 RepID=F7NFM0_9FIRM|nr:nucleotidyltransferase [Acetonema longum]EGO65143.1 hypothetical protein ALO_04246 [Acetonema longum DSM 6540]